MPLSPPLPPAPNEERQLAELRRLLRVVARLRAPDGCPWDRAQDRRSLLPYFMEECHELVEAVEAGEPRAQLEELGDLLFHLALHARIAQEAGDYDLGTAARSAADKMISRHPQLFGGPAEAGEGGPEERWERLKAREEGRGALDGLPRSLPALLWAYRAGEKVARFGFDWPDREGVRRKLDEELAELDEALASGERSAILHEYGDVLLALANLGRFLGVEPEQALRAANRRFAERFHLLERLAPAPLDQLDAGQLDALWERAKALLREDGEGSP